MTRFRPFLSLRVRLILLVLLALIPALAIMLYTAAETRQREAKRVENEALTLVRLLSANQESTILVFSYPLLDAAGQLQAVVFAVIELVDIGVPRFEGDNFTAVGGRIFKGGYEK